MLTEKRIFLETFYDFIHSLEDNDCYGKCYFKLLNGVEYLGWILEINEETFTYLDSGPLAHDEPYIFEIINIDVHSFGYRDANLKAWVDYMNPIPDR